MPPVQSAPDYLQEEPEVNAGASATSLLDRLYAWRDRLLTSHRFQRFAANFPLTRPIARRRARALFDLCAGFVYSQTLLACIRLDLFPILQEGPAAAPEIARRLRLSEEATERLMLAACSLGLAARRSGGRYGLGELGAALLGNPGLAEMIEHHALLYADLRDPVALLRGERPATALEGFWPYAGEDRPGEIEGERVSDYSRLMAATQPMIAAEVLDSYDVSRHRLLMDVGGGEGVFLTEAAKRAPDLRLRLFDLPAVADRAKTRFETLDLGERSEVVGGDFRRDPLPAGADLISLVRIVHDHEDETARSLLKAAHAALEPGGTLLLAEPMAGTPGAEAMADAYFGFYLLAMGRGRARRAEELTAMLQQAGFTRIRALSTPTPLLVRALRAQKV